MERAHDLGRIRELVRLILRSQDGQHFAFAHRHIERPDVEERMAEREDLLAVVVSDRAESGDAHIAGYEDSGDGLARLQRGLPVGGRLAGRQCVARAALDRGDAELAEERRIIAQHVLVESGKHQRSGDGREAEALECRGLLMRGRRVPACGRRRAASDRID